MISGARYHRVTTYSVRSTASFPVLRPRDSPKSHSFRSQFEFSRMFDGFRSRCRTCRQGGTRKLKFSEYGESSSCQYRWFESSRVFEGFRSRCRTLVGERAWATDRVMVGRYVPLRMGRGSVYLFSSGLWLANPNG